MYFSSSILRQLLSCCRQGEYIFLNTGTSGISYEAYARERMLALASDTHAGIVYSDYYEEKASGKNLIRLIDYQQGSLRDDFEFGPLLLLRADAVEECLDKTDADYEFAELYDLRLRISERYGIVHVDEALYTEKKDSPLGQTSGQFDYVDSKNRKIQLEMEKACTAYLQRTGAYLPPRYEKLNLDEGAFECEASVIIPVKNREKTIRDAVESALSQKTNFKFNLIVADNHSTDGTTEKIDRYGSDKRLIHIVPESKNLGIGGCWNLALHDSRCGRFAVQLDSDDLYASADVLQRIVDCFRSEACAMVVGSYRLTDFELNEIPPGIIDHREWSDENGRNNALRINGLGAPRAFFTPLARKINFPDVSYGEDYSMGLAICRHYRIGRIYDVLYNCRRWDDNTDAHLDREKSNRNNFYKDKIRTFELMARRNINAKGHD